MSRAEEAPLEIFEWLEKFDIHQLQEKDRSTVLSYFTEEEYEDMRSAVKVLDKRTEAEQVAARYKSEALTRFDEQHHRKNKRVPLIWKLAAALLPLMLIAVTYWFAKGQAAERQALVVHDTVYLHTQSQVNTVYDTVFIEKVAQAKAGSQKKLSQERISGYSGIFQATKEIDVVPITEKEEVQNTTRNYSIRDDSLFSLFPSVAL